MKTMKIFTEEINDIIINMAEQDGMTTNNIAKCLILDGSIIR